MPELFSFIFHWLHVAICTLGYLTFALIVLALINEWVEWITRGDSARPLPEEKKGWFRWPNWMN